MKTVSYKTPDGVSVEVPEADAPHFDSIGWERIGSKAPKKEVSEDEALEAEIRAEMEEEQKEGGRKGRNSNK